MAAGRRASPTYADVTLQPSTQEIEIELPSREVSGSVVSDLGGGPLENALVRLIPADSDGPDFNCRFDAPTKRGVGDTAPKPLVFKLRFGEVAMRTGADGRFRFEDVSLKAYELVVECPGHLRLALPFSLGASARTELGSHALTPLGGIEGVVVGPGKRRTPGSGVVELHGTSGFEERMPLSAAGRFEFTDLVPGRYRLVVRVGAVEHVEAVEVRGGLSRLDIRLR